LGDVEIPTTVGTLVAYLAEPAGADRVPGVIVVHEAFGLNDDIRAQAERLARAGYLALAPDLYSRGGAKRCLVATMLALNRGHGRAFEDIDRAHGWLVAHQRCTGRVGIIGFCMGGGFALACAPRGRFAAAAPNYGIVARRAETALAGACPIVGSYGGRDWMLRGHARRLRSALDRLGVPHDVKEYPEAAHSFMNHHTGTLATTLDRISRIAYVPAAADDAWARILDFFGRHLGPAGAAGSPAAR
jgi:carboxymethylenebutenolidase